MRTWINRTTKIKLIAEILGHSKEAAGAIIRKHYLAREEVSAAIGKGRERKRNEIAKWPFLCKTPSEKISQY